MPGSPPSFGTIWRPFRAGSAAGQPLNEWAYINPDYPDGISVRALQAASERLQRQTVMYWFVLNFVQSAEKSAPGGQPQPLAAHGPFKLAPFNIQQFNEHSRNNIASAIGWDATPRAPAPARRLLDAEFEGIIPAHVITEVADQLPGLWVWVDGSPPAVPNIASLTRDQSMKFILNRLDTLEAAFLALSADRGGIGHNEGQTYDLPLSKGERVEAVTAVQNSRAALTAPPPNWRVFNLNWAKVFAFAQKVALWACKKADLFFEEAAKSAGKWVGPVLALGTIAMAAHAFHDAQWVAEVLARLKPPG